MIEQTETAKQLEDRQKKAAAFDKPKTLKRAICNMVTKGTFKAINQTYEAKYVLSIKKHGNEIGVTFFDVTTLKIFVGQFDDDAQMTNLRTLCS